MSAPLQFLLFFVTAFGYSLAAWGVLKSHRIRPYVHVAIALVVCFTPLMIGFRHVMLRALACVVACELMFKMIDYARCQRIKADTSKTFLDYASFLIPLFPFMLVSFAKRGRPGQAHESSHGSILVIALALAVSVSGFAVVHGLSNIEAVRSSFLLDHALKVVVFIVTVEAISRTLHGLECLAGFTTTPLIHNAFLSSTVGEFWCRYNTRVHAWLSDNIFDPVGGRRAPVRGIVLTFFVSAILHEVGFGMATSRFDGYQFTFFMVQIPAVLVSRRLHRFAASHGIGGKILAHVLTVAWMGTTAVLFFHGVDRVFPFVYAAEPYLP